MPEWIGVYASWYGRRSTKAGSGTAVLGFTKI